MVYKCSCKNAGVIFCQRNVPAEMQDDSAGCGLLLHFCRAFPLTADVPAKVQETFKSDLFVAPVWRNNPLTAETPSRLEEQSADGGNILQIGGTIRWWRKRPPVWRDNPLAAETPSSLEEQSAEVLS